MCSGPWSATYDLGGITFRKIKGEAVCFRRMLKNVRYTCLQVLFSEYLEYIQSFCCEATRLGSRLIQVAYVTSLGCLCPKPASFEISGCKYVCMYVFHRICLDFKMSLQIEPLLFRSRSIQEENLKNTRGKLKARGISCFV